ncbi:DNA-binding MarR family transcriptional regulator [Fontibacillus phaseoli]|uniref:DNA-binding MarR family transcriptional regulator n=1 Tax=Fontibacillus phaseoli TaxID=1416533 RepID=A0A369BPX6_9BACL|nr:MarR family transcriptional regulator [Fontibacillus phaseoli]RCX22698.1 DNA-binding MarR family transcriptional regulator [Fontibacillus phaseoli]
MKTNSKTPIPGSSQSNTGSLRLGQLILQLRKLESSPKFYGTETALTPSEIHMIDAIGEDGGVLMKELAARLGITKGAVTQIVDRLEAKAFVKRSPHPHISRGILVTLTESGKEAYRAHARMHLAFYDQLRNSFTEEEIDIFEKCVAKLSDILRE